MSINVTVSGNPVSIKRGKMITSTDPEAAKKEFEKRRLLRLEQVRQQSKELAENVRNKVQKEKKRQLGQIEKDGMYFKFISLLCTYNSIIIQKVKGKGY